MYSLIKAVLFGFDPEKIHYWTMRQLRRGLKIAMVRKFIEKRYKVTKHSSLQKELWGLRFKNPVGLAAGFDKDARFMDDLAVLGFGFFEIGTVTPKGQSGNDKPRLFRLPEDKALINRMGFNNEGVRAAAKRLRKRKNKLIIGGNIGKNKITPNEAADEDYETCLRELYDTVDYFTVNVSSPNTPNLRALQDKAPLKKLLTRLQKVNADLGHPKPILLKIAPDLNKTQLDEVIELVLDIALDGMVATNTTISREGLKTTKSKVETMGAGGLSGRPVQQRSTEVIKYIHEQSKGKFPIIASGGIFSADDAREKIEAGASLVQIYTGFIYEGPDIVRNICRGLSG